ncbi:MAG: hypothetical protein CM1200mP11_2350 [Nitrosopumilaceae archaeon]|nr:MAG: hypothetical protein CM1200mP11_2350 [Nitrosopumilaceae archaeon]
MIHKKKHSTILKKVSGVASTTTTADDDYVELLKSDRIDIIKSVFEIMKFNC